MNDMIVIVVSIMLLLILLREAYYRNKPKPPKELILAFFMFLMGMGFFYEALQGHTMFNHGFVVDSWQIGVGGIIFFIAAVYCLRIGLNKNEKIKIENNFFQIHKDNIKKNADDSDIKLF